MQTEELIFSVSPSTKQFYFCLSCVSSKERTLCTWKERETTVKIYTTKEIRRKMAARALHITIERSDWRGKWKHLQSSVWPRDQ